MAHYLPEAEYRALVAALVDPIPTPGCDRCDAVIEALGEIGDVWPDTIKVDALLAARRDHFRPLPTFGEFWPE